MKKNLFTKVCTVTMTAALAASATVPALPVQAAEKQVSVYVIADITASGDSEEYSEFTYYKNGLEKTITQGTYATLINKYFYSDKKPVLVKNVYKTDSKKEVSTSTFVYYKKGQLTKTISVEANGATSVSKFSYKKGKLVKAKDGGTGATWNFTYNKKGLRKTMSTENQGFSLSFKISYNKNDEISKVVSKSVIPEGKETNRTKSVMNLKYKYNKKGRKSVTVSSDTSYRMAGSKETYHYSTSTTYKYTYKKIKVPASYAETVKQQQKEIANEIGLLAMVNIYLQTKSQVTPKAVSL